MLSKQELWNKAGTSEIITRDDLGVDPSDNDYGFVILNEGFTLKSLDKRRLNKMNGTIEIPAELIETFETYKTKYAELEKRKASGEPSIDHWRLNSEVSKMEQQILEYIRGL